MQDTKQPAVYIMANKKHGVIYTGVTSQLEARVYQHKSGEIEGFTKKYHCKYLVYYEAYETMESAITREKQIKGWLRKKKITLIENMNPNWNDLYSELF